jgi:hypothetical protein
MPKSVTEYRCLLISPSDLTEERDALQEVIAKWNAQVGKGLNARIELVRWENHAKPEMGDSPQSLINSQIVEDCDLGIALFWSRIGTETENHPSGSVEEIYKLIELGLRVMVYFSDAPIPQEQIDDEQYKKLQAVKEKFLKEGLLFSFSSVANLKEMVLLHLTSAISELLSSERTGANLAKQQPQLSTAPKPDIQVSASNTVLIERGPFAQNDYRPYITITARNRSPRPVFLSAVGFIGKTEDDKSALILEDSATKAPFNRKRLEPGESFSISVDPKHIERVTDLENFQTIRFEDEAGYDYELTEEDYRQLVQAYKSKE